MNANEPSLHRKCKNVIDDGVPVTVTTENLKLYIYMKLRHNAISTIS